jgi:Ni/Co efflux regulator RcnB
MKQLLSILAIALALAVPSVQAADKKADGKKPVAEKSVKKKQHKKYEHKKAAPPKKGDKGKKIAPPALTQPIK